MNIHVTTKHSLRAGFPEQEPGECPFCNRKTAFFDWVGASCDTCGWQTDCTKAWLINRIRGKFKIKRSVIADALGVKPKTVSVYEHDIPSERYFNDFKQYIRDLISEMENNQ